MKRAISMLTVLVMLLGLVMTGCNRTTGSGSLKLENGILTWDAAKDASYYEVDLGGGGQVTQETSYNLAAQCEFSGEFTVTVRKVDSEGKRTDIGSMAVIASMLPKPIVGVAGSGEDVAFVWSPAEGASGYSYDAHDGNGLRLATPEEDGTYRVAITNTDAQMIRVVANGNSVENNLLLSSETIYQYESGRIFDMALTATYPAVFTSAGKGGKETLLVGTTLEKGIYDLEVSMYLMDARGMQLSGNGTWGRRIFDNAANNFWFCENELEGWPGIEGNIPYPDEVYTATLNLTVDRSGNAVIPFFDFNLDEMVVVADIKYEGQSVLSADGGLPKPVPEIEKFDLSTLNNYLKVFRSPGGYYNDSPDSFNIEIPTDLSDGQHTVDITYYLCTETGDMIEGNGMWGRRLSVEDVDQQSFTWFNEYDIDENHLGVELPEPTEAVTSRFTVEVKNGHFTLVGLDFMAGEMIIFEKVEEADIPSGNGVYVSTGELQEKFEIQTTLASDTRYTNVTLSITYRVSDINGESLHGNGTWGRRIRDSVLTDHWLCEEGLAEYPDSINSLPEAGELVTQDFFFSEINKKGVITLMMHDFLVGEMVEVTSIQYNGQEVLVK